MKEGPPTNYDDDTDRMIADFNQYMWQQARDSGNYSNLMHWIRSHAADGSDEPDQQNAVSVESDLKQEGSRPWSWNHIEGRLPWDTFGDVPKGDNFYGE